MELGKIEAGTVQWNCRSIWTDAQELQPRQRKNVRASRNMQIFCKLFLQLSISRRLLRNRCSAGTPRGSIPADLRSEHYGAMVNSWEHRIQDNGANNKNTNWTGTPRCRKCLVALLLYSGWQIDVSVRCSDATTTSQTGAIYIVHSSAMWPRGLPLLLVDRRTAPENTSHIFTPA